MTTPVVNIPPTLGAIPKAPNVWNEKLSTLWSTPLGSPPGRRHSSCCRSRGGMRAWPVHRPTHAPATSPQNMNKTKNPSCRHSVAACVSDHSRACERIPLRHRSNPQEKNNIVIPEFSAWLTLVLERCRAENIRNLPRQRAPTPLFPERRPREACSMPISGCHDLPLATFNLPLTPRFPLPHGMSGRSRGQHMSGTTVQPGGSPLSKTSSCRLSAANAHSGSIRPDAGATPLPNSSCCRSRGGMRGWPVHRPTHAPATSPQNKRQQRPPPKTKTPRAVTLWRHACLTTPEGVKESPPDIGATSKEKNNIVIPEFSAWLTLVLEQCRAENIRNLPRQRAPTPLFPERRPREACSMPISGCHDLPLATFNLPLTPRAAAPAAACVAGRSRGQPCSRNGSQSNRKSESFAPNQKHPRAVSPEAACVV